MKYSNKYQVTAIKNHCITNATRSVVEQGDYLQGKLLVLMHNNEPLCLLALFVMRQRNNNNKMAWTMYNDTVLSLN